MKKFALLFILMVFMLACSLSGSTSKSNDDDEDEKEKRPSRTPRDSAVEVTEEPILIEETEIEEPVTYGDAPQFFLDEFDGSIDENFWFIEYLYYPEDEEDEEATPVYSAVQRRDVLRVDIETPWVYLYYMYEPHVYDDVRIDFEVENKGVNSNNVGLICRYTDYGWYEFVTTSGGYYSIWRYYEDGSEELATGGIKSIRFGANKKNVYTAICKGNVMTLLVNDVEIAKVKDEEIPDAGYAGINVSSEDLVPVQVEVNWIEISAP